MKALAIGLVLCAALVGPQAWVEGCTASMMLDKARSSITSDSARTARDVAREELDRAGIEADVWHKAINDVTGTPIDAATGSLLIDRFGGQKDAVTDNSMTVQAWRDFLGAASGGMYYSKHPGVVSVRDHLLYHGREIDSWQRINAPKTTYTAAPPTTSTATTTSASSPATSSALAPAPAPAPAAPAIDFVHRAG